MRLSDSKLVQLKKLAAERRHGSRAHYSAAIKDSVRNLATSGVSLKTLVDATGIGYQTLRSWVKGPSKAKVTKNFRQVKVSYQETFDLVFPNGMMVKGLSFKQLLELADRATAA